MLEAARAETITLYACIELLDEVAEVLQRPKLIARLNHIGTSPQELIDEYQALVALVSVDLLPQAVSTDPDDDVVLACALAAQAHVIVSGDADLLLLTMFQSIPILTVHDFLDQLGS